MLAAILPLPRRPEAYENPEGMSSVAQVSDYDGRGYPQSVLPSDISVDEKRWQKANWWRTVNRILSILGLLIIAAVVCIPNCRNKQYMEAGKMTTDHVKF